MYFTQQYLPAIKHSIYSDFLGWNPSKTWMDFLWILWCYNSKHHTLYRHHCEYLKYILYTAFSSKTKPAQTLKFIVSLSMQVLLWLQLCVCIWILLFKLNNISSVKIHISYFLKLNNMSTLCWKIKSTNCDWQMMLTIGSQTSLCCWKIMKVSTLDWGKKLFIHISIFHA